MHFEKYAGKWRLEDVSVMIVCWHQQRNISSRADLQNGTFLQNAVNIKTCSGSSILVNENWDKDVTIDT